MTVDADVTMEILRDIREELRRTRTELKDEIASVRVEFKAEIGSVRDELKLVNSRLEVVEHTLTDFAAQHLLLTRFVKNVATRHDDDIEDLRTRVERLETRK